MLKSFLVALVLWTSPPVQGQVGGGKLSTPVPPEVVAQRKEVSDLTDKGIHLIQEGQDVAALPVLELAAIKEDAVYGHCSTAKYQLAMLLARLGRTDQALATYRKAFKWDSQRGDLTTSGPDPVHLAMDYALLLSKSGKSEEAKAIYYFGLRCLNSKVAPSRFVEPAPFLVVFDPETEGCSWEYSAVRFEAAATMVKVTHGPVGKLTEGQMLARARELAPDWFYPTLWKASGAWNSPEGARLLDEAEQLAKPGLETELIRQYRTDLAEHRSLNLANDTPLAEDERPMREASIRRARMACLRPKPDILKRLSLGG